jgi:hypothetical protein
MSDKLNWCYYQGMKLEEAIIYCNSTSENIVTERIIKNAKDKIFKQTGKTWK